MCFPSLGRRTSQQVVVSRACGSSIGTSIALWPIPTALAFIASTDHFAHQEEGISVGHIQTLALSGK